MSPQSEEWRSFDDGSTIGTQGSEAGLIVLDEEYADATRISLERAAHTAPFAITCGVYGRMMHTRFFETEEEAKRQYDAMKCALQQIVDGFDSDKEEDRDYAREVLYGFVNRFPT